MVAPKKQGGHSLKAIIQKPAKQWVVSHWFLRLPGGKGNAEHFGKMTLDWFVDSGDCVKKFGMWNVPTVGCYRDVVETPHYKLYCYMIQYSHKSTAAQFAHKHIPNDIKSWPQTGSLTVIFPNICLCISALLLNETF